MKILRNSARQLVKTMLVFGFTSAMGVIPLFAQVISTYGTLADLVANNGTLTIGDKTFSDFSYVTSLGAGGQLDPQAAGLTVSAFIGSDGVYYLNFNGGLNVNNSGSSVLSGDLLINYTVTVNDPSRPIFMIDQAFTANAQAGSGNVVIGETVFSTSAGGNSQLSAFNPVDLFDLGPTTAEANDNLGISPNALILAVSKDIRIDANGGTLLNPTIVGMSQVSQSFHQVPEPSAMLLGSLGGGLLLFLRLRRQARRD